MCPDADHGEPREEARDETPRGPGERDARPTTFRTVLLGLLLLTSVLAWWEFRYLRIGRPAPPTARLDPRQELVEYEGKRIRAVYDLPYNVLPGVRADQLAMDLFVAESEKNCPVLIYLHGGGWIGGNKNGIGPKAMYFASRGILVASVNYRLCYPRAGQNGALDVADAMKFLRRYAGSFGGDPNRMFVMGHSAGAHLGALAICDPAMLPADVAGAVRGAVLLDGSAYDVPAMMAAPAEIDFTQFFGTNPADWPPVSPYQFAMKRRGLPPMLLVHAGNEPVRRMSAQRLAAALEAGGSKAYLVDIPFRDHNSVDGTIGQEGDPLGPVILKFIAADGVMP